MSTVKTQLDKPDASAVAYPKSSSVPHTDVASAIEAIDTRLAVVEADYSNDMEGPASSTDGGFAKFDGITGKLLKDSAAVVVVADGGTGRSTGTTAYALVATGTTATGAQQTLASGATTEVLVGGGASALPVWTTATGSGAPVRATSPALATPTIAGFTINATAATTLSGGTLREVLSAARTYYVRTDGSDSNSGLADTAGGAFLTIQACLNRVLSAIDFGGYAVTIQVRSGSYAAVSMTGPWTGGGTLTITGDTGTPANVSIDISGTPFNITATLPGALTIQGFKLKTSGGNALVMFSGVGKVFVSNLELAGQLTSGAFVGMLTVDNPGATMVMTSGITVSGSGSCWVSCGFGYFQSYGQTVTMTGTPAFSWSTVVVTAGAYAYFAGITFSGSATGTRYTGQGNCYINTGGGGASYFPGDAAGSVDASSTYA